MNSLSSFIVKRFVALLFAGALLGPVLGNALYVATPTLRYAWTKVTLSNDDALRIQTANITEFVETMYRSQPKIPDGDLTKFAIVSGALVGFIPDAPFDSIANERVRQSMDRLRVNEAAGTITDPYGGRLLITSYDNKVKVSYLNLH